MRKTCFYLIVSLLSGTSAMATERWHTAQIKRIYPQGDGAFVIMFETESAYCSSTATPKYYLVGSGSNGVTAEGEKKIYAAAMTAIALGRQVMVAFDDSTTNCAVNRLIMLEN
jgi:hypothetical protein